jgi:hypothetical protein
VAVAREQHRAGESPDTGTDHNDASHRLFSSRNPRRPYRAGRRAGHSSIDGAWINSCARHD